MHKKVENPKDINPCSCLITRLLIVANDDDLEASALQCQPEMNGVTF